ncbi:SMP-30/gluconolactonase/LRE family protein [Pontibacter sp. E15-1]|uniref:SMP-30/gluconolactonase/LRE family protein n=1 Tax=Pontibacter sp. E15-1 TaxID=2919918 RepID=UPI001F4F86E3|nr:SMP-30/gluconolactonase/LRE family protein [Pontibacter sp. E15-1]MCJ8166969.1 SMP-30/gluconolactonase/LRE family protein [Pontibacter sp. E15-1]
MDRLLFALLLCLVPLAAFVAPQDLTAKLVLDAKARLGEGAIWHPTEKKLYWLDIQAAMLHIYDPATKKDTQLPTGERAGTIVPIKGGGVLLAMQNSIRMLDTKTGKLTLISRPLNDTLVRFNDGKADPSGRLWVGTMAHDIKPKASALYRMDKDKSFHIMLDSVTISNGLVWTADKKTMYYVDSPTYTVQAFDYDDATGGISNGRVVVRVPASENGSPDGMVIDTEGTLWIALWGGGAVIRCDPATGKIIQRVRVPALNVTSLAFGGKNLATLYITTVREWQTPEQLEEYPLSGGIFAVKPGVRGVPAEFYQGQL